jgi:DNA-binding transcriptional ArsR family regulator
MKWSRHLVTEELIRDAVRVFKAMADPTRYQIVCLLLEHGEMSCGQLGERFELSPSAMSHHYKVLENAGLVTSRKEGVHGYYRLNSDRLAQFLPGFRQAHMKAVVSHQ